MTVRLKMTVCMVGLLSVLFGIGGSLLIALSFQDSLEREQETAYGAYNMVLGTLQVVDSVNGPLEADDITSTLDQLTAQNDVGWTALRVSTSEQTVYEYNAAHLAQLFEQPQTGTSTIGYATLDSGVHMVVLSGALEAGDETLYVDISRDVSALIAARDAQLVTYLWVFFALTALCGILSYTVARLITRPLVGLSRASRAIACGDLAGRATIATNDEIGRVARDFNAMADTLERTITELEDTARRQDRFVGSFAHEIKTPLTSIIGYADLLRGQTLSESEQIEAACYIVSEGKRLESLSQKLLSLLVLKGEQPILAPASPKALIEGLAARMMPFFAKRGIELACECEAGRCLLDCDLVSSLLINLWDNAAKAMDASGGTLFVRSRMIPNGCEICVSDEGRGIPPEAIEHVTEAFYRADASRARTQGGAGLGLALCQEIVAAHKGSIRFRSSVGIGTAVIVELKGGTA
ncbi:sensor histidine kinase [Raoultibacter phocaeensis]|uniref:sensor histidine kinase n=1 Tax=Raoultibacter phocaeensis TaxID=2479841 RepID=UPI00111AAB0C|nr:HAMP domain-containing sensor histidine kinase [Raoultibacter phocaeensis]